MTLVARLLALLVAITCFLVPVSASAPASAAPDNYSPRAGITFNSPVGSRAAKQAIFRKIIRSINSSSAGSTIKIFSWNFLSREATDSLLRAQNRGVMVRVLMDRSNRTELDNRPFRRLGAGLKKGNEKRNRYSWARTCSGSCRGSAGAAHSKFFMFSKAGKVRRVVMHGSANLTLASTANQWNDLYTYTGSRKIWKFFDRVFDEASRDKRAKKPFAVLKNPHSRMMMFPLIGKGASDPVMGLLNKVRCKGATNTASHRTRLRIAPDVIRQDRGMKLARKVRSLWNQGCDIKIGYTVVGVAIGRYLRSPYGRGRVPMKHLVQDFDGDGEFDNYFHLKAMSIVGNVGGQRNGYVVLNGSANWSGYSRVSDENLGIYWSKSQTLRYQAHLEFWYNNFPSVSASSSSTRFGKRAAARGSDDLVFGTGENAVYEDGTPYSRTGVDPFAKAPQD